MTEASASLFRRFQRLQNYQLAQAFDVLLCLLTHVSDDILLSKLSLELNLSLVDLLDLLLLLSFLVEAMLQRRTDVQ